MKETKTKNVMRLCILQVHVHSMAAMSKISINFSPQNNTCNISLLNTSKAAGAVQVLSTFARFCLKEIVSTFLPFAILQSKTSYCMSRVMGSTS